MMDKFNGFNEKTTEYFWGVCLDNSKSYYEKNKQNYIDYIRDPLRLLHRELAPVVMEIDESMCMIPGRCISRAFNDFRYTGKMYPVKDYMYLHFCASVANEDADTPGLFFSANHSEWSCGFFVYHATNAGMAAFRKSVLQNMDEFSAIVETLDKNPHIQLIGEDYKRDHYPDILSNVRRYLNKKRFYLVFKQPINDLFCSSVLVNTIAQTWRLLAPMYHFYMNSLQ